MLTWEEGDPWNSMYVSTIWEKKAFETVLSAQGLKGWKGPIVPKGTSPLTSLYIHTIPHRNLAALLPVNQYVNIFTPHPANSVNPQNKGLLAFLAFLPLWLPGLWPPGLQPLGLWPLTHLPPWPLALLCPEIIPFTLTPTLTRPALFHKNRSPINPACTPIDSLIYNSLLHWREEPNFWEFFP